MKCDAYRAGDEMHCACGVSWAVNDPDRPACRRQRHVEPGRVPIEVTRALAADRRAGADRRSFGVTLREMPDTLPFDTLTAMAAAASKAAGYHFSTIQGLEAMAAAYRVLLDRLG